MVNLGGGGRPGCSEVELHHELKHRSSKRPGSGTFLLHACGLPGMHRRQPTVAIGLGSIHQREKFLLQSFGDRSAAALSDLDPVNGAYGRDLRRRSAEKDFVSDIK